MSLVPLIALNAANAGAMKKATTSIVSHFRTARALSPGDAIAWAPADRPQESEHKRLLDNGALVEMRPGQFYLNEEKLAASKNGAGVLAVVLLAVAALIGGASLLALASS